MNFKMKMARILINMEIPVLKYFKPDWLRRSQILKYHGIDLLFDVGANAGQYGEMSRVLGYKGKIVSFEPVTDAYKRLEKASAKDSKWIINRYALGDIAGKTTINVSGNSFSSSILEMEDAHVEGAPESKYIGTEEIEIKTLNEVFHSFYEKGNKVMLKIDTQGYEKNVLVGSEAVLEHITLIQLEMSLVQLYQNEVLYREIIDYLDEKGFILISLENGFSDAKTKHLLQVDGIFLNTKHLN
jgi:FkbM family methyltransferase